MRKLALRLTVALAAAAVATTVALADTDNALKKKKKKGLFSSLFSTNYERKRKPNTNSKWWLDRNGEVRIIFGGSGDDFADAGFDDDPEGVTEGYGMGNLTYVAPKLAALGGQELKDTRPVETMAAAIYDGIASPDLGIRVLPEARDAILGHYRATGFRPLWIENGRLSPRAAAVLAILADAITKEQAMLIRAPSQRISDGTVDVLDEVAVTREANTARSRVAARAGVPLE